MSKRGFGAGWVAALVVAGCGNEVVLEGTGGDATSSSAKGTSSVMATTSVGSTGVTSTSTTTPAFCAGLSQTACLDAWPKCAPLYDDVCCPSCAPGACADCINMQFYGCYEVSQVCGGTTPCGVASKENCAGQPAVCADDYCPANAGCVVACKPDAGGQCDVSECHAVTVGTCTSFCDGIPPNCPPELTAEQDGGCYTGFCIPDQVCNQQ